MIMTLREYGYVIASKYRTLIMRSLYTGPKTPKQISTEMGIPMSCTSRALRELMRQALVVCETPEYVKGRIYRLTDKGMVVAKMLETLER